MLIKIRSQENHWHFQSLQQIDKRLLWSLSWFISKSTLYPAIWVTVGAFTLLKILSTKFVHKFGDYLSLFWVTGWIVLFKILIKLTCMYYLNNEQRCFTDIKHEATAECFISHKAGTASVLNSLKNDPSYEFIGEEI